MCTALPDLDDASGGGEVLDGHEFAVDDLVAEGPGGLRVVQRFADEVTEVLYLGVAVRRSPAR